MSIEDFWLTFQRWRELRKKSRQEKLEAQRLHDEEFQRSHEPCPQCEEQIPKGLTVCPICEAPFADAAALQTWKLQQEIVQLRKQASEAHEQDKEERRKKRGNNQGCGCMLMLGAIVVGIMFPPLGGLIFVIGLVMLIVGLCS